MAEVKMANKERNAEGYIRNHKILELFENLTAQLIFERPEDPKAYMKQYLEKLKDARTVERNYPCIFDDSNIKSLFGMLDVTGKGFITYEQYKQGLATLGVKSFNKDPPGSDMDRISSEVFLKEARSGLAQASATFA
ncbi:EF-hand calcium-binding domain-containing protein 10-like [Acropora millepora]|uniref:EF-hand calcium-binding domain-containing protein 10-like n=1 Tax=Acropora millepora TaxID=45264 RepID=UPI001CF1ACDE|nr:EF-hand calcium-binding domain-containing protein 10-like [Acropora millepora]